MGLENQSVEVLARILQYLSLETVINMRLVSRFFDHLILVNLPHTQRLGQQMSAALISKLLYQKVLDDKDLFAQVEKVANQVNHTLLRFDDKTCTPQKLLGSLCDAITFCCGRKWVIDHMRHSLDWTDNWADNETMVLAAWLGRLRTVNGLLDSGCSVDLRHEYLGSLMYAAAFNDDGDLADFLIKKDMNLGDSEGAYGDPFQLAAYRGSATVVQYLLKSKLPLLAYTTSVGHGPFGSPLGAAAAAGYAGIIVTLIHSAQRLNIVGPGSQTPLHYAARNRRVEAVDELLCIGADIDLPDDDEYTALDLAAIHGHVDVVSVFMEYSLDSKFGAVALRHAAAHGQKDVVQILLADHTFARPDPYYKDLPPAIFEAAFADHFQVVDILLAGDQGEVHLDYPAARRTLLTWVADCGSVAMLRHILASGKVDVNELDENRDTALHVACVLNEPELVRALLDNKDLNPNVKDGEGETALSIALDKKFEEIVAMLIADDRVEK